MDYSSLEGTFLIEEACSSNIPTMYKLEKVYYANKSKYCEIIIGYNPTFGKVLFLDKELQSSSYDEKIYHEFLVHPVMKKKRNMSDGSKLDVLVIGGGEGGTVREVLKWPNVSHIDWVDLDIELVELCKKHLKYCDDSVYTNSKVHYVPDDIMHYFSVSNKKYDVIIVDLPDPECDESVEHELYTKRFWNYVKIHLKESGLVSTHCGPILYGKEESNREGLEYVKSQTSAVGFDEGSSYHVYIPSFQSEWAFWMSCASGSHTSSVSFPDDCIIIDENSERYAFYWPKYMFSEFISNKE